MRMAGTAISAVCLAAVAALGDRDAVDIPAKRKPSKNEDQSRPAGLFGAFSACVSSAANALAKVCASPGQRAET
jgi:hypothetical protein